MKSLVVAALVLVGMVPYRALSAQRMEATQSASLVLRPLVVARADSDVSRFGVHMTPIAPASPRAAEEGRSSAAGNVFRAAIGVGAGALVGGWLGYFGAQVGRSDWDRVSSSEKSSLRQSYTTAGLGVGALLGYFMRPKVRARGTLPQPMNIPARSGRQLFGATELRRSIATNALEAIELDRPEWTKPQRDDEAKNGSAPRTGPVESVSLVVYVGDERVGGIETLRDIAIPEVAELRFYDARDARHRWGVEHRYGAIEVVPASAASASEGASPLAPTAGSTK